MTQTAVQWLFDKINSDEYTHAFGRTYISPVFLDEALEIEKQQQIDFATQFAKDYIGFDSVSTDPNAASPAEIYYNQIKK
jgi:hypothetical protein